MRKWSELLVGGFALALVGCGGGAKDVQNQPPPPVQQVSIAFQPAPPQSIQVNATAELTAVVKDDSGNPGVDWTLACTGNNNCGSLSALHTESGKATIYTPPANLSGNQQTVIITAFATADHTKNVVTALTVIGFAGTLKGTYVLQTSGMDGSGWSYQFAAAVTLDGNGVVTGGEQTYSNTLMTASDAISGGNYSVGPDGRGTLSLRTANQTLGQHGLETFSLVVLSSSQVLIARIDDPNLDPSTESSVGTMDLQTSKAAPAGGYAFVVNGSDLFSNPVALGGVLNIDTSNTISGAGSVVDQDLAGGLITNATVSGTVSGPDTFGKVNFSLTTSFSPAPLQFAGYLVDAIHIKLIETDLNPSHFVGAETGGVAIGQGPAMGTFTDNSAFSGQFTFGVLGIDLNSFLPASLTSAGVFSADGQGHLTDGYNDEFLGGLFVRVSEKFKGRYSVDALGTGRVDSFITFKRKKFVRPEIIFYLTGNGNPPLMLHADSNAFTQGTGIAYPAAAQPSFSGQYGFGFTQNTLSGIENDAVAQMAVDPTAQTITGMVDTNATFVAVLDTPLSGTFASTANVYRAKGALANEVFQVNPDGIQVAYYLIDSDHGFTVERDGKQTGQVTFGYFARRTPVCPACP